MVAGKYLENNFQGLRRKCNRSIVPWADKVCTCDAINMHAHKVFSL